MTNLEIARHNYQQYLMADFAFMAGRGKKPEPAFYGYSGGNTMSVNGETFNCEALAPSTAPIHAGF